MAIAKSSPVGSGISTVACGWVLRVRFGAALHPVCFPPKVLLLLLLLVADEETEAGR